MAGPVSEPYIGSSGSYDGNLVAAADQEGYDRSQQMDESSESSRERRRDRDRDRERERDGDRDYSRRHRSDDR